MTKNHRWTPVEFRGGKYVVVFTHRGRFNETDFDFRNGAPFQTLDQARVWAEGLPAGTSYKVWGAGSSRLGEPAWYGQAKAKAKARHGVGTPERALAEDERMLRKMKASLRTLHVGGHVPNLTVAGAQSNIRGLAAAIRNKKALMGIGTPERAHMPVVHSHVGDSKGRTITAEDLIRAAFTRRGKR